MKDEMFPELAEHPNKGEELDPGRSYLAPLKKINEGHDVSNFLQSKAYHDIMSFVLQLNRAMFPTFEQDDGTNSITNWATDATCIKASDAVCSLGSLLTTLGSIINEAPPDQGPRRFGNVAFRKWYDIVTSRASELLSGALPTLPTKSHVELVPYLLGSFGSAQRLDYGSGHELSFLAFLGCLWKIGVFDQSHAAEESRAIVINIFEPYFQLIRQLVKTYTLEPAGSHGVWGLDDHSFLPYIFGSAQLGPPIRSTDMTPTEGSLEGAPDPGDVAQAGKSARHKDSNMYFSAIHFIHEVKKGPFFEHSPMLYDISGVRAGWAKINKGMIKMYDAEVLHKFPVVQHFPFGSLFSWERDPGAKEVSTNVHLASQPERAPGTSSSLPKEASTASAMKAPWATDKKINLESEQGTKAPWATGATPAPRIEQGTRAPWAAAGGMAGGRNPPSRRTDAPLRGLKEGSSSEIPSNSKSNMPPPTRAPWAKPT